MSTAKYPEECDIVATLSPKPGKLERVSSPSEGTILDLCADIIKVVELLTNLTAAVQKNEPDVFSFHLYKDFDAETGKEQLVLMEKYVFQK